MNGVWPAHQPVIIFDGLHPPHRREGATTLEGGDHPLRIEHFQNDGGARLALEWRPPGAPRAALAEPVRRHRSAFYFGRYFLRYSALARVVIVSKPPSMRQLAPLM